ncbi:lipase [Taibaiella sp. KBW10]|uniref:lipase family protein n=1 Tax=Taibaiella sp. KBW10 TaxID=2153357 RepID=UPI000F5B13B0|nr:lipase family protein [Taibaiella sp. KBW10]RQO29764.1 lipase [Taibaiella sp. KBW10]
MIKRIHSFVFLFICLLSQAVTAQKLKPGFDKEEYKQMMYISARTGGSNPEYYAHIPAPDYRMVYRSAPMGLDNLWDFWISNSGDVAVISLRGTTQKAESWVNNFYAAMVPAKGSLELSGTERFDYELSTDPRAAVHVGWLLSTGYLSKDIMPKLDSVYRSGIKQVVIMGHSQGGAIAYLVTAYFYNLQSKGLLPADIRFKTYCSAGPKPGNLYFAYDYESKTQAGWAYNVVNAADWVPETPMSIQTLNDFNVVNPFKDAKKMIRKQPFLQRTVLNYMFNKLERPTRKAQRNYERFLGRKTAGLVQKSLKEFKAPQYYHSNDYVRTGAYIVLYPDADYFTKYPNVNQTNVFINHLHEPYLYLLDKLK